MKYLANGKTKIIAAHAARGFIIFVTFLIFIIVMSYRYVLPRCLVITDFTDDYVSQSPVAKSRIELQIPLQHFNLWNKCFLPARKIFFVADLFEDPDRSKLVGNTKPLLIDAYTNESKNEEIWPGQSVGVFMDDYYNVSVVKNNKIVGTLGDMRKYYKSIHIYAARFTLFPK